MTERRVTSRKRESKAHARRDAAAGVHPGTETETGTGTDADG